MRYFPILLFFFTVNLLSGQDRIPAELGSKFYLKLFTPSLGYEMKLAPKQSVVFNGGLRYLTDGDDFSFGSLNPFLQVDVRNYYPRKKVKKELRVNSGNYVGLIGGYVFEGIASNADLFNFDNEREYYFAGVWGMQRNYKSGIHLNLQLGPGIAADQDGADFRFMVQFDFGFVLGK